MATATETPLQRADELLREMTIEEKAMQSSRVVPLALLGPDGPMRGQLDSLLANGIGHVAGIGLFGHKMPDEIAKSVNAIQRYLVTETRSRSRRSSTTRHSTAWSPQASAPSRRRSGSRRNGIPMPSR